MIEHDGYHFWSEEHRDVYINGKKLLADEAARQSADSIRLEREWATYPESIKTEKRAWLHRHFAECRKPLEKIVIDALTLAVPIVRLDDYKPHLFNPDFRIT